jgi:hypothetical protein
VDATATAAVPPFIPPPGCCCLLTARPWSSTETPSATCDSSTGQHSVLTDRPVIAHTEVLAICVALKGWG